jgi:23S rRNA (guanosine2251-2'-O)-methyltransferase
MNQEPAMPNHTAPRPEPLAEFLWISGRQPVREALRAALPARRLWLKRGARGPALDEIRQLAQRAGLRPEEHDNAELDRRLKHTEHRGVALELRPAPLPLLQDWLPQLPRERRDGLFLLLLDGLQDPQNLGAVARSALAAGVDALVLPPGGRAPLSDAAFRASAGALAWQPLLGCNSLEGALELLGSQGLLRIGVSERGEGSVYDPPPPRPLALVLGAEGRGLSPGVRSRLDLRLRIPMRGPVASLNASVAAGVVLFHLVQPPESLEGNPDA